MHKSLAHQLHHQIIWLIATGELKHGDCLPSLRQAAERLSINLHTVRSAYKMLETEGMVETRQGRETRVIGFDPRRSAQVLAEVRSYTVGVIVASLANPFYYAFLRGLSEEADKNQTLLFICDTQDDPSEAWRYFIQLSAKQVDGIIVISHNVDELLDGKDGTPPYKTKTLPLITVDAPDAFGPVVLLDLKGAGFQATRHLIEHGHRRIGLISYLYASPNAVEVNEGYYLALQEAGIQRDPALVAGVTAFDVAAGAEGARRLANLPQPPTAIFTIADTLAVGALQTLKSMGLRVPEDIALVGIDDIPLAALLDPPLTTVSAPSYDMGITAMRMLQTLIAGKNLSQPRVVFPTSLVIRQSCGCQANS
ncbi:MAG: substrate-binding domain-containing protein [Chloroflexi bacterium]|nr:substrate-binding domain-containing protein [Chloroflexota bacterium]